MTAAARERIRITATGWDTPLAYDILRCAPAAPEGRQVTVRVEACGVCHRDLLDRTGRFPFIQLPVTPGHEASGIVTAVGPDVRDWHVGDRVATMHRDACGQCARCLLGETTFCPNATAALGLLWDGGYASDLCVPESALYGIPGGLSPAEAAVLHCTFGTAFRDLSTLGRLQPGETVLITGANGGVGSAAIQVARRLRANVIAVIRDERHRSFVERMGAHSVVVNSGKDFHQEPAVGKVDLALDTVGAPTFMAALRSVRVGGRIVTVGNVTPEKIPLNLGLLITLGLSIIGGSGATRIDMEGVLALHRREPFQIPIDRELPLAAADDAQHLVSQGNLQGRIVLRTSSDGSRRAEQR